MVRLKYGAPTPVSFRRPSRRELLQTLPFAAGGAAEGCGKAIGPFRLATFEADITPPLGTPYLGGVRARSTVDPLYAKGFVLLGERRQRRRPGGARTGARSAIQGPGLVGRVDPDVIEKAVARRGDRRSGVEAACLFDSSGRPPRPCPTQLVALAPLRLQALRWAYARRTRGVGLGPSHHSRK